MPSSPSTLEYTWDSSSVSGVNYLYLEVTTVISAVKIVLVSVKKDSSDIAALKYVDFLRQSHGNYFYLSSDQVTNVTLNSNNDINIYQLASDARTDVSSVASVTGATLAPASSQTFVKGFYRIHYGTTVGSFTSKFYTDAYHCPFPSGFYDVHAVFAGCTPNPSVSGELINLHAQYVIQAHACGVRQFFNGTCNNVNSSCNTFDALSGRCYTCADNTINPDSNGVCTPLSTQITCSTGQHQVAGLCIPDTCAAVDSNNQCTSCVSVIYTVSSGACVRKTCSSGFSLNEQTGNCQIVCTSGQQEINGACYNVPANCISLTSALQCSGCIDPQKYQLSGGSCKVCTGGSNSNFPCVMCASNQIVSTSGVCIHKYSYCSVVNSENGQCSSCSSGFAPNNGYCCPSGQATPSGVCPGGASNNNNNLTRDLESPDFKFCHILDVPSVTCKECKTGYKFRTNTDICILIQ